MRKILIFVMLLVITSTFGQPLANRYILTTDVLTVTEADRSTFWTMTFGDVVTLIERNISTLPEVTFSDSIYFGGNVTVVGTLAGSATGSFLDLDVSNDAVIDSALYVQTINFGTLSGGTADSLYIDFTPNLPTLTAGLEICFVADSTNTAAATITVDGTEKNIYEANDVSAVDSGDIVAGAVVKLVYDGTQWQQISQSGN